MSILYMLLFTIFGTYVLCGASIAEPAFSLVFIVGYILYVLKPHYKDNS